MEETTQNRIQYQLKKVIKMQNLCKSDDEKIVFLRSLSYCEKAQNFPMF